MSYEDFINPSFGDEMIPPDNPIGDNGLISDLSQVDAEQFIKNHTFSMTWTEDQTQGTGLSGSHTPEWNSIAKHLHLIAMRKVQVVAGEITDGTNPNVYNTPNSIKFKIAQNQIGRQDTSLLFNGALWRITLGKGTDVKTFDHLQVSSWNDLANLCNVLTGGDTTIPVFAEVYLLEDNTKNGLTKIAHEGAIVTDLRGTGRRFNGNYRAVATPLGRYINTDEAQVIQLYQDIIQAAWPSQSIAWPFPPNPDTIGRVIWVSRRHSGNKQYGLFPAARYVPTGDRQVYNTDTNTWTTSMGGQFRMNAIRFARIDLETLNVQVLDQNDHGIVGKKDYFNGDLSKYSYVFIVSLRNMSHSEEIAVFLRPVGPDALLLPPEDWTKHKVIGIAKTGGQAPITKVLPGRYGVELTGISGTNAVVNPLAAVRRSARKPFNDGNGRTLPSIFLRVWEEGTPFVGPESPFVIRFSENHGKPGTGYFAVDYAG